MTYDPMLKLSVVIPVRNEQGNITPLIEEVETALRSVCTFEIIYVDDASTDDTPTELVQNAGLYPYVSYIRHAQACGQSCAIRTGVRQARGAFVATLDGDGQNDPRFLPDMLRLLETTGPTCGLVQGQRVGRKDTPFKRVQSRMANKIRGFFLQDNIRDTGCGLKCFRREAYLALPYFDALHRFMPALMKREGYEVACLDVIDRPRGQGRSNYGFWDRLRVGVVDLMGVYWLLRRRKHIPLLVQEIGERV